MECTGDKWSKPGLRKCKCATHQHIFNLTQTHNHNLRVFLSICVFLPDSCELAFNTNCMNKKLKLSDDNRKVTYVEETQEYLPNQERFEWRQLLCDAGLTGRCYWEVDCFGYVDISVSYRSIRRKGDRDDCLFGRNSQSWSMHCTSGGRFALWHNNNGIISPSRSTSCVYPVSNRLAVYMDHAAGSLSFYLVSADSSLVHLHTFSNTFTEPLYPGFSFEFGSLGSSVTLCPP